MTTSRPRLGRALASALFALVLSGCANSSPVDGRALNGVTTIRDLFTSAFLVPTDDGVVLVDAGFRAGVVLGALEDAGFSPEDVTDVLLTHGHGDHTAAVPDLPQATVRALPEEAAVLEEEGGPSIDEPLAPGEFVLGGVTCAEAREVAQIAAQQDRCRVVVLGTAIATDKDVVREVCGMEDRRGEDAR